MLNMRNKGKKMHRHAFLIEQNSVYPSQVSHAIWLYFPALSRATESKVVHQENLARGLGKIRSVIYFFL